MTSSIQQALLSEGSPLKAISDQATGITSKLTDVVQKVQDAPTTIAKAAAAVVDEKIAAAATAVDQKIASAGLGDTPVNAATTTSDTNAGISSNNSNSYGNSNNYSDNSSNENAGYENENENAGNENENENAGNENENENAGNENENENAGNENDPNAISGGGYQTVYLTKPVKNLHVFYLDGKPIYFTDNGKGRVKIIPMHTDMQMASSSSRHKYTKKIRRAKKKKNTRKSKVKGVRKTSRRGKQNRSRRRR
jgi:hypothetical protein